MMKVKSDKFCVGMCVTDVSLYTNIWSQSKLQQTHDYLQ